MKLPIADCRLPIEAAQGGKGCTQTTPAAGGLPGVLGAKIGNRKSKIENGFTMVEIAICLAIIGIALVAIIGVLPIGINVQKDNRQETLVDQDAAVFMENIRNGARGLDDLTNYVFAITNSWTEYNANGAVTSSNANGYTRSSISVTSPPYNAGSYLTNGANIIGILTTPEYTDPNTGAPIPNLFNGGISNHVVAYVRSMSGPAVEKPPQNNSIIIGDSFSYKMICDNVPVAINASAWNRAQLYYPGNVVFYASPTNSYWKAVRRGTGQDPGTDPQYWVPDNYSQSLAGNAHELRLTFLWPLLPNNSTGNGRHTFATTVAGQIVTNGVANTSALVYFFQPQSFVSAP